MSIDPQHVTGIVHSEPLGGGPVLDPDTLEALIELGGDDDPDLVLELVELFLDDAGRRVATISGALDRGDIESVARAAHALKSASANLGATTFSTACRELEGVARRGEDVTAAASKIAAMYPEVASALDGLRSA